MAPLTGLSAKNALGEVTAGITLVAIAVPLNIGYAQIAGLPPAAGLYALIVPVIVYTLLVSSRQVVASPDAAAAALVASSLGGLAAAGSAGYVAMALAQAIICGLLLVLASIFKLGFLANFLSKPILIGFIAGLAVDILISQVLKMLGIPTPPGAEFWEKLSVVATEGASMNEWSVLIAAGAIAVLVLGRRFAPRIPWALIVLILATVVVAWMGADSRGVAVLGPVDAGPPSLTWPMLDWVTWLTLVPSAIALAMVIMAEGLLISRRYSERRGYPVRLNRDLFAVGAANVASGATGGFAIGASASRTAAMDQAGSRTQLPGLVAAAATLLLLLFGTGLLESIPSPAIGAIVAIAVLPLLGIGEFRELWRQDRAEFAIAIACFLVTLFVGAIPGIVTAFVLALINLARRASRPAIDVLAADDDPQASLLDPAEHGTTTAPGIVVIRLGAPLFFANAPVFAESVKRTVAATPDLKHVVLSLEAVTDIDVSGADAVRALGPWLADRGITLAYSRASTRILDRMRTLDILDAEPVYPTNRAAIAALRAAP